LIVATSHCQPKNRVDECRFALRGAKNLKYKPSPQCAFNRPDPLNPTWGPPGQGQLESDCERCQSAVSVVWKTNSGRLVHGPYCPRFLVSLDNWNSDAASGGLSFYVQLPKVSAGDPSGEQRHVHQASHPRFSHITSLFDSNNGV